ncbi:MAG: winged helix-turn-helix transcriptional regulator [Polyangiaceae bacterium]
MLGERWTLLILRNLLLGPRRYSDLMAELPGITTNLLARRLRDLEQDGLVEKRTLPRPAATTVYALSESGEALEPALMELAKWGGRYLDHPNPDDRFDIGWALLSMKRRYRGGLSLSMRLEVDERVFAIDCEPESVQVKEREPERPQLTLRGGLEAVVDLFFLQGNPSQLIQQGRIELVGTRESLRRLLAAFPPSKNPALFAGHANAR